MNLLLIAFVTLAGALVIQTHRRIQRLERLVRLLAHARTQDRGISPEEAVGRLPRVRVATQS